MGKAHFKTHAHIKSIIGKDLITDDNIAVLELVKNSFDAGSKKVEIIFRNISNNDDDETRNFLTKRSSKLIIRDYGIGMSETDISDKWLNIAYSEKKEKKEDFGRMMAGNKGVGRFSCDRLGRFLIMYSRVEGQDYRKLFIDWKLFEREGDINFNIQDVEFDIETISPEKFEEETGYVGFKNGTIIELNFLRGQWNADKILNLRRHLEKLINPNQAFKSNPFAINIIANEFLEFDEKQSENSKINGPVKNRIFESLNFKTTSIKAEIDSDGKFIMSTLQDRGNEIFTLKEKNPFYLLKSITVNIYYLSTYSKAYFTKQTGIRSVDFGSIYLFINGFRIPPYGDEGDDWLGMEKRKGQGYNRFLGTREVVGRIEITDQDEAFKIISNRSGIVNNPNFDQLTKSESPYGYYYKIFRRLERYVVEGIKWDSTLENDRSIEKKVNDPNWTESKERYAEDSLSRNKRAISVINNIIDTKKDDIDELKINDKFVNSIINQQIEIAQKELEEVIQKVSDKTKDLSPIEITSVINKLSQNSTILDSFSKVLSNYSIPITKESNDFTSLQESYLNNLNRMLLLEEHLKQEENQKKKLEEENQRLVAESEAEKKRNTFLLATANHANPDALGLIHHIQNETPKINSQTQTLIDKFLANDYKISDVIKRLHTIKLLSDKVLKISNLITRANFNAKAETQPIDIVKYFEQYIGLFQEITGDDTTINIELETNEVNFWSRLSVINLSIIIDNLISNSIKAKANKILIIIENQDNNILTINFSDNGDGVPEKYLKSIDEIFKLGETSRMGGSGIGLYTVKDLLTKMRGKITFLGNNIYLHGATFQLTFIKYTTKEK